MSDPTGNLASSHRAGIFGVPPGLAVVATLLVGFLGGTVFGTKLARPDIRIVPLACNESSTCCSMVSKANPEAACTLAETEMGEGPEFNIQCPPIADKLREMLSEGEPCDCDDDTTNQSARCVDVCKEMGENKCRWATITELATNEENQATVGPDGRFELTAQ